MTGNRMTGPAALGYTAHGSGDIPHEPDWAAES